MAIEDAYQLAKDLSKARDSFKQPWFNLEKILVVSQFYTVFLSVCQSNLTTSVVRVLVTSLQ